MPYKPIDSMTLADRPFKQIRLGLQSAPFVGKTTSALTAPNVVVADFDNKLSASNVAYAGKKLEDIIIIPFYDATFCDKLAPRSNKIFQTNRRDAFAKWLATEAPKLQNDQTLLIDSWTMLQEAFDQQQKYEPAYVKSGAKQGQEDFRVFWERKMEYAEDVCSRLKTLSCHVIVTFHEIMERDEEGKTTGKLKAFMQGRFADKLSGHFTDWFRQHAVSKRKDPANPRSEIIGAEYLWQTMPDDLANCGTHLHGLKRLVPANWDVFVHPENYKIS